MSLAGKLKIGTKVKINAKGELLGKFGVVRYVGILEGKEADGEYVGLELSEAIGKNNGTYKDVEYFKTKPNFGAFMKPTSLVMINGTPVSTLVGAAGSVASKAPPATKAVVGSKLSKDLDIVAMESKENPIQKELDSAYERIKELEETDWKKEADALKAQLKELEESNRKLNIENEKVKYAVKQKDEGKEKELVEQIQFFKSQKEAIEKEKADLKKKNAQLNAELEEYAESMDMVETLTQKIETIEAKNEKLKQQLETANGELKNLKMVGGGVKVDQGELEQNIKVLNQTVALLESDLLDAKTQSDELKAELEKSGANSAEMKKMERKLKQKDQELEATMAELEVNSEAAAFAEKLTLDLLRKDQELKEATVKLNQYIKKVEDLENEVAINKEFSDELNIQLMNQEELMDRYSKEMQEKNRHLAELNRQIQKYKKRIFQITQNSDSMLNSGISQPDREEEEEISKPYLGFDQYQTKYYNSLKVNQNIRESLLRNQIQFSDIRNQVGVYMLNLNEALPESFTSKLYPEVIQTVTSIKSANDKLYYIFQTIINTFKFKQEIYSKENYDLSQWLILLMKEIVMMYGSLHRLEFSLTTAESEQQLSEVLAHRILKDQVRKIDTFSLELLNRFAEDNISASIDFDPYTEPIENLDEINLQLKRNFSKEYDMKMRLCVDAMETITTTFQMIVNFKQASELGENAEVDNLLENLIKSITEYLFECCMNPYIRYKAEMKNYLEGLSLVNSIFNDIKLEGNYNQLSSLYSETENIVMLKDTILTTQFHVKELLNDLQDIIYPNALSKLQTQLPGKVWIDRIKLIKEELLRVKELTEEKVELEQNLTEAKKKILLLERDLKDKQNTKELYERRIGEMQIKLEQAGPLENQNKRQLEKIKALEEANKIIEDQITEQSKKRKMLQEQLKKVKERFDLLQTETMMRSKRQKTNQALSSEDVANLAIFKNAIKESNTLRTLDLKKKVMQLKQSSIFNLKEKKDPKKEELHNVSIARRKALDQMSKFEIQDPFNTKKTQNPVSLDSILKDIDQLNLVKSGAKKSEEPSFVSIGTLYVSGQPSTNAVFHESKKSIRIH